MTGEEVVEQAKEMMSYDLIARLLSDADADEIADEIVALAEAGFSPKPPAVDGKEG